MKNYALLLAAILAALAVLPARASDEQLTCTPGATIQIAGTAPPVTPLLARFGGRVVAGSMSNAAGAYTIALKMGQERPGTHAVTVEARGSGEVLQRLSCVVPGAGAPTAIPDGAAPATTPVRAPTAPTATSAAVGNVPQPQGACATNAPAPLAGLQAWMSDTAPEPGATIYLCVRLIVNGAPIGDETISARAQFASKSTDYTGITQDGTGVAEIEIDTGQPTPGYTVRVGATATYDEQTYTASTSFTPQ